MHENRQCSSITPDLGIRAGNAFAPNMQHSSVILNGDPPLADGARRDGGT